MIDKISKLAGVCKHCDYALVRHDHESGLTILHCSLPDHDDDSTRHDHTVSRHNPPAGRNLPLLGHSAR